MAAWFAERHITGCATEDQKTGQLRQLDVKATKVYPDRPLKSYKSTIHYADAPVANLGKLLLPVSAEVKVCLQNGTCFRNELSFHDCRKFGSESTIIPDAEPAP